MLKRILRYLNIQSEVEDFDEIHNNICKAIIFKGTNLWILVAAIIIACVGLNINSPAVIIGAMLISPLMGPINGMGYSIATNDIPLFKSSIKNFTFAVLTALAASTLYFALSPVSNAQSEILARTSPTIYDVLIAIFGGVAGIIAISSKQKGNVIPGVAIATALMPPLCTAGYGIATVQLNFVFGAIYLFTINTVCIGLASIVVSQILKFPIRSNIADSHKRRINHIITLVLIITILPSFYLGYKLVQNEKFLINAEKYTESVGIYQGNYLLKSNINPDKKQIHLIYGGTSLTEEDKEFIARRALDFQIDYEDITIEQGLSVESGLEERNLLHEKSLIQENTLKQEIARLNEIIKVKDTRFDSISNRMQTGKLLLTEISPLYPQIETCSYSEAYTFSSDSAQTTEKEDIVIFGLNGNINTTDREKIKEWLQKRLDSENVTAVFDRN